MNLAVQLRDQLTNPNLTPDKRAQLCCQLAKELEERGDGEGARAAMGELWQRVGERPKLEGLDPKAAAEVLLRAGVLTGWIGSIRQIENAQETAKNLITESITIFEALQDAARADEAQIEMAVCYWRAGSLDDARMILQEVLKRLDKSAGELRAIALLRLAMVEKVATRLHDALILHMEAAPLFEGITNHTLKGKFHGEFGTVLKNLGAAEHREDYRDRAFVEHAAASFHFEQAGHKVYCACVENNLAMLFLTVSKFNEAHEHLDRARHMLASLKDSLHLAQVNETRAKVLLAEGRNGEAEKIASAAVQTLEKGDEQLLLAEALTTQGTALARTGKHVRARLTLQRAVVIAEQAGDKAAAGRAALTIIEEISEQSAPIELSMHFEHAVENFTDAQRGISARLVECARIVLRRLRPAATDASARLFGIPPNWEKFSLRKEVRRYERFLIERALKDAGGFVTKAAYLLGYKHHYSLVDLINKHHKSLLSARTPVIQRRPRQRSITQKKRGISYNSEKLVRPVTILHVEDHRAVADAVKDTLESEGWRVVTCSDGATALKRMASDARYGLMIFDNHLPNVNGLELVRYARQLPHRQHTPIIMLSASDVEAEAYSAGVDAFLRKPQDIEQLTATVARLLNKDTLSNTQEKTS